MTAFSSGIEIYPPYPSFRGGVAEPGIHGVRRAAGKPNPMDSRLRGNDGVFIPESRCIHRTRHSGVGKLFVIPGPASYPSFRGAAGEPGIHGVRRAAGKPNPMDSRLRGNDGVFIPESRCIHRTRHSGAPQANPESMGFVVRLGNPTPWIPAYAGMTAFSFRNRDVSTVPVTPGPASYSSFRSRQVIRHSGAPQANPESMGFVVRLGKPKPMDSRLRGNSSQRPFQHTSASGPGLPMPKPCT